MTLLGSDVLVCGGYNGRLSVILRAIHRVYQHVGDDHSATARGHRLLPDDHTVRPTVRVRWVRMAAAHSTPSTHSITGGVRARLWSRHCTVTRLSSSTRTRRSCAAGAMEHACAQSACYSYAAASDAWSKAAQLNTARYVMAWLYTKVCRIALFVRIILFGNAGRVLVYGGCANGSDFGNSGNVVG